MIVWGRVVFENWLSGVVEKKNTDLNILPKKLKVLKKPSETHRWWIYFGIPVFFFFITP